MQFYSAHQGGTEGLEAFCPCLSGKAAKFGWTQIIRKGVLRDIFLAKVKFSDIQREFCTRPGATINDTLKAPLIHGKDYATANNQQKQNNSSS